ncbi:uncharacterized protein N7477_000165 [Penicillium maclennaniae]|uniref:uncharacterized protein n=1 Tax=Penicillium maclennaniae TaxID=1343394 RepID=UPI002541AB77|nr:uncharacterized protein N7477_000165 [Penicillium maclennaniae]KAJ5683820.1 hypothetical protein N7477_000165 [Penicillium maclennaniae]
MISGPVQPIGLSLLPPSAPRRLLGVVTFQPQATNHVTTQFQPLLLVSSANSGFRPQSSSSKSGI